MVAEDWLPDFDEDEYQDAQEVRCKKCGERYLFWERAISGHFVLVNEDGDIHECPAYAPAKISDFDPV